MNTEDAEAQNASASAADRGGASQGGHHELGQAAQPRKRSQQALDDYLSALFPMPEAATEPSAERPESKAELGTGDVPGTRDVAASQQGTGRASDEDAAWIERALIEPNPSQPRRTWSEESLRDLGSSLARDGQLQACVVRPHPSQAGHYQLVSGERRWRAAAPEFANLQRLRCIVRPMDDDESMRLALIENLQREDLNDIDKARAFVELRESLRASDPRVTWSHVGQAVGLSREYLQRLKALLDLPQEVQEMVRGGALSGRSARALTGLRDAALQTQLAHEIQEGRLSSDQALERARALASAKSAAQVAPPESSGVAAVTRESRAEVEQGGSWEESMKQAVQLLQRARQQAGQPTLRKKKARKLVEQARAHIEALSQDLGRE